MARHSEHWNRANAADAEDNESGNVCISMPTRRTKAFFIRMPRVSYIEKEIHVRSAIS